MNDKQIEEIKKHYTYPFRYSSVAQHIFDKNNDLCLDVRGWGRVCKEKRALSIHNNFGQLVADLLNEKLGGEG